MRSSFLRKSRAGFTLVELLVVIAIKVLLDGQPLSGAQVQLLPKGDVALI